MWHGRTGVSRRQPPFPSRKYIPREKDMSVERGINLCPHRTHNCAAAGEIVGTTVLAQRPEYVGQRTSRCYGNALQLVQFWLGGKFDTRKIETSSRMRRWCLSSIMLQAVWVA